MKLFYSFFLFTFSLLLAETVFAQHVAYIYSNNITFLISIGFFGSLAIGNLLGLHRYFKKFKFSNLHLLHANCLLISLLGLIYFQQAGFLWLTISFLGAGIFLSQAFQKIQLRTLIISAGMASVLFYLLLNPLYAAFQSGIIPVTFLLAMIGSLIFNTDQDQPAAQTPPALNSILRSRTKRFKKLLFIAAEVFVVLTLYRSGGFRMLSKLEAKSPGLENAQRIIPTDYTPLILTDLVWAPRLHSYYILTNGQRFSQVIQPRNLELNLQSEPANSLDAPYLLRRPKKILIIGAAGGLNVWIALKYNPEEIVAVDINPAVFKIMNGRLLDETESFYLNPKIRRVVDEGRHFLETTKETFDLIVLQGVQTGTHNSVSNVAVLESFLFTKEAIQKMWSKLNPEGMIFLEEYKSLNSDTNELGVTLLGSVAHTSQELWADHPEQFQLFFQFPQSPKNPSANKVGYRLREGLILSKTPVQAQAPLLTAALEKQKFEFIHVPLNSDFSSEHSITDNNPFFARQMSSGLTLKILKVLVFAFFSIIIVVLRIFRKQQQRLAYQSLFVLGIAYIAFVMALVGPATLFMGHPQLAIPIVYGALFFFAMFGGIISLKFANWCRHWGALAAACVVGILPVLYFALKPFVLSTESLFFRGSVIVCLVGLVAVALEMPYIAILAKLENPTERAGGYALGKMGVLVGMVISLWVELQFGFLGAVVTSVIFYLFAAALNFVSLRTTK